MVRDSPGNVRWDRAAGRETTNPLLTRGRDPRPVGPGPFWGHGWVPAGLGKSGGTPEHQTGSQFIFVPLMSGRFAFDLVQQGLEGNLGQLVLGHLNRRERRNSKLRQVDIVETDYRKVIRYLDIVVVSFPHNSNGGHVVRAQHRSGPVS